MAKINSKSAQGCSILNKRTEQGAPSGRSEAILIRTPVAGHAEL